MSREIFDTDWIKLEVTGDDYNLQPDPYGLIDAARELIGRGFRVFAYTTDDLVVCSRLRDLGCEVIMPWGSPIGTGKGLLNPYALETLRARLPDVSLVVDAGIGLPSHAARALELGFDGVLLNTAVARADAPVDMALAFGLAVRAGPARLARRRHGRGPDGRAVHARRWHAFLARRAGLNSFPQLASRRREGPSFPTSFRSRDAARPRTPRSSGAGDAGAGTSRRSGPGPPCCRPGPSRHAMRPGAVGLGPADGRVDGNARYVDALRHEFPRHALGEAGLRLAGMAKAPLLG